MTPKTCPICGFPVRTMVFGHDYDESDFHRSCVGTCEDRLVELVTEAHQRYKQARDAAFYVADGMKRHIAFVRQQYKVSPDDA